MPQTYLSLIEKEIQSLKLDNRPAELYEPIRYMLNIGGKRIRPVLVLMGNELFGGNTETVLKAATGIEVFHNFTLLHDDIMDNAPLRRSKTTVHEKWNSNIAILSGDTMFVQSCQLVSSVDDKHLRKVLNLFYKTAIEVCEGQQLDMNFEKLDNVTIDEYIEMISLKTAVLLGCALSVGAICAGANDSDAQKIYDFGKNLGIAFQLKDDILDAYGDSSKFGKKVGGDIIANKKTYLLIKALQLAQEVQKNELLQLLSSKTISETEKVNSVLNIFNDLNIRKISEDASASFYQLALENLNTISTTPEKKAPLLELARGLMVREN
ncbi:MAG: polyprenyl synthetase family protein [Bacteroidia bacterium]